MGITLTLPETLSVKLERRAKLRRQSVEHIAFTILDESLDQSDTERELEALVARIKALPPNPNAIRPATGSLAEYLAQSIASEDPNEEFDQEEWQRECDAMEAEMKAAERARREQYRER